MLFCKLWFCYRGQAKGFQTRGLSDQTQLFWPKLTGLGLFAFPEHEILPATHWEVTSLCPCTLCLLFPPTFIFVVCLLPPWLIRQQDANTACKAAGQITPLLCSPLCLFSLLGIYFCFSLFCFLSMSSSSPGSLHSRCSSKEDDFRSWKLSLLSPSPAVGIYSIS